MSMPLRVVTAETAVADPVAPPLAERIRLLQAEAKALATDQVAALAKSLTELHRLAAEIADGGAVFPPGVRDLAGRLSDDAQAKALTLEAIMARTGRQAQKS
jgi:hypothetical protein